MNQPAVSSQPEIPNTLPNSDFPIEQTKDYQEEIDNLLLAVEKFRKSGQVEESEVSFAKEKILPKLGYSRQQINQLGPVGIMVKLQEEADKKKLTSKDTDSNRDQQNQTPTREQSSNEADQNNETDLVKEVVNMTDSLSSEIDKEIKRQLEEKKSLEQAQEKVDNVLAQHEELNIPDSTKENDSLRPTIGLFHTQVQHDREASKPVLHSNIYPPIAETAADSSTLTDPLTASIEFALNSLKEGDPVGNEWTLRKILTTSFGNKKSPFYELVNQSGASWTLSPEEMRDVLRSSIFSDNKTLVKEIKGEKPEPLHDIGLEKEAENSQLTEPENYAEPTITQEEQKPKEEPTNETVSKSTKADEAEIPENSQDTQQNPGESPEIISKPVKFSQKQIEFLNKIHADTSLWSSFTSFSPALWESFNSLYEQGKLINIGIDAHPLFDKLSSNEYFSLIDIQKGDTASALLSEAGYNLTWTSEDAEVFAVHIIANYKLLSDSAHKMEVSGLANATLPSTKNAIELAIAAKNGNSESLHKLFEALNFLPVGSKFKLIKANQLESLKKYFSR